MGPMWPAMSLHFGIRPWELNLLSRLELAEYVRALEVIAKEQSG